MGLRQEMSGCLCHWVALVGEGRFSASCTRPLLSRTTDRYRHRTISDHCSVELYAIASPGDARVAHPRCVKGSQPCQEASQCSSAQTAGFPRAKRMKPFHTCLSIVLSAFYGIMSVKNVRLISLTSPRDCLHLARCCPQLCCLHLPAYWMAASTY